METPQQNCFSAGFAECYGFSSRDPAGAAVFVERGSFDVRFYCVVEDVRWLFSRDVVVVD